MRTRAFAILSCLPLFAVICACSSTPTTAVDASAAPEEDASTASDTSTPVAQDGALPIQDASDASIDKAARCAATFGSALTAGFGRLDGTVLAIVQPKDKQCALPNNDHVIVQLKLLGAVYRVVVNVQSDRAGADIRVSYLEKAMKLPAPAWAEGWHTGVTLDYVKDLGVKASEFTPFTLLELSGKIADVIPLDAKVSVYSDTSGGSSTHLVHRNDGTKDGAIVLDPEGPSPKAMLFRFATQDF